MEIVEAITAAYHADLYPERIRAVVLTNPNNPLGRCYAPEVLRECLWFCHAHDLHFISDEVYALSAFRTDPGSPPFTSALSLLDGEAGSDTSRVPPIMASRVHVVWSLSKDFGCSGVRLVRFHHPFRLVRGRFPFHVLGLTRTGLHCNPGQRRPAPRGRTCELLAGLFARE
jgi:hypothetical protein